MVEPQQQPKEQTPDQEQSNELIIRSANVTSVKLEEERDQTMKQNTDKLLAYIRDNVIGANSNTLLRTAYGEKPHLYVDYTASGKSLRFIEDYI